MNKTQERVAEENRRLRQVLSATEDAWGRDIDKLAAVSKLVLEADEAVRKLVREITRILGDEGAKRE